MASCTTSLSEAEMNSAKPPDFQPASEKDNHEDNLNNDHDILPGAKISESIVFKDKLDNQVKVTPVLVEFRRLLQTGNDVDVVPGIRNKDLLHAAVGLYDVSLGEMTPDTIYATLCERWSRTIILLKDTNDTISDLQKKRKQVVEDENKECEEEPFKETEDVYVTEDGPPNAFEEVYSDTDNESSEEEDDNEAENFSKGIYSFIRSATKRRQQRQKENKLDKEHVGIENRIVGAITFKKTYIKPSDKVIHLTLVAVRKRYQKFGIGKYLLLQVKDPRIVGQFDAVVVHADNSAMEFFQKYGFSDDFILNSRFSELAEQFTNCTLMCYLPPFTGHTLLSSSIPELDLYAMEKEIVKWRERNLEAYRAEITCVTRLRNEIIHLRSLTSSQQEIINTLSAENNRLRVEKNLIEKEYMSFKLATGKTAYDDNLNEEEDEISTAALIRELERHVTISREARSKIASNEARPLSSNEPYDHGRDTEDFYNLTKEFKEGMNKDRTVINDYDVKMINKALLPKTVTEKFERKTKTLKEPNMVVRLYYCGLLEKPSRSDEILKNGFSEEDFSHGEYGRGLYFSKYPSKAAQFSAFGKLLVASVAIGHPETVLMKDRTRTENDSEFDCCLTPGRLSKPDDAEMEGSLCHEYVVFDVNQAKPLYLLEYSAVCS